MTSSFYTACYYMAEQVFAIAESVDAKKDPVSAREAISALPATIGEPTSSSMEIRAILVLSVSGTSSLRHSMLTASNRASLLYQVSGPVSKHTARRSATTNQLVLSSMPTRTIAQCQPFSSAADTTPHKKKATTRSAARSCLAALIVYNMKVPATQPCADNKILAYIRLVDCRDTYSRLP